MLRRAPQRHPTVDPVPRGIHDPAIQSNGEAAFVMIPLPVSRMAVAMGRPQIDWMSPRTTKLLLVEVVGESPVQHAEVGAVVAVDRAVHAGPEHAVRNRARRIGDGAA